MTVRVRVIPCLDVRDGRVVKGVNFVDLVDAGDPVEQAQAYDRAGADELCFLDISASHEGRGTLLDMVRRTAEVCFMPLTVGGGVRSVEDARALLLAGADKVAVNSAAVSRPELVSEIAEKFGSQCVVASVDARVVTLAGGAQLQGSDEAGQAVEVRSEFLEARLDEGIVRTDQPVQVVHGTQQLSAAGLVYERDRGRLRFDGPVRARLAGVRR